INEDEFTNFINFASSIGVDRLGFTLLSSDLIFRKFGVLYPNVIVIIKEMDKNRIDKAPSRETQEMVMGTYKTMNFIGNKLAKYLRNKGFGAQAGPALGGVSNYVPLAEQAGLGWHGRHGLLITPEFGPRQRIALIYTSIENLPVKERSENEHKWIGDFCGKCGKCIKNCPGNAIL
ncbi:MAG: [Fe-S]-binding protein, partial [archaeon]|nr:[Fe-S]-binding protein [archaeon]